MVKRVLVVATSGIAPEAAGAAIAERYGDDVEIEVVATPSGISRLDWLTNAEDDARRDARERAAQVAGALPVEPVGVEVGDEDPVQAIADALKTFDATEVVLVTCADEQESWLEGDAPEAARKRFDVPVSRLVVG